MPFKTFNDGDVLTASDVNTYLMKQAVIGCTSGTRPASPVEGMMIYETDTDLIRAYTGSGWETIAGIIRAAVTSRQNGQFTVTATTYGITTTGGTYVDCGTAFVVPWSGQVTLSWAAGTASSGAFDVFVSPVVRTGGTVGSGSAVAAADDNTSVRGSGTGATRTGADHLLSGLTAGLTYNVRLEHRVGAGTGTISSRSVIVTPTT